MTAPFRRSYAPVQPTDVSANEALESNLDLIERASRRFRLSDLDRQDAYQEAALAFLLHYPNFDPSRGVPLAAYLWPHVLGAVRHHVRRLVADRNVIADLDPIDLELAAPSSVSDAIVDVDVVWFLHSLRSDDLDLIVRRFWYDETPVNIARSLGVSRQTIHARQRRLLARGQTVITAATAAA